MLQWGMKGAWDYLIMAQELPDETHPIRSDHSQAAWFVTP